MSQTNRKTYILSIETTVNGGSLAFFNNSELIDVWQGSAEISKAEDVLPQIQILLDRNQIEKSQLALIIVSKPELSLTGGKIGSALAKGLAKACNCKSLEISLFDALLSTIFEFKAGKYLTILPIGNYRTGWKIFNYVNERLDPIKEGFEVGTVSELISLMEKSQFNGIVMPAFQKDLLDLPDLCEFDSKYVQNLNIIKAEKSLAELNVRYFDCSNKSQSHPDEAEPIYNNHPFKHAD